MLKEVKVGGVLYKVMFPFEFSDPLLVGLHEEYQTCIKVAKLVGNRKRHPDIINETLLHEVLHAVDSTYLRGDIEHKIIEQLSMGWFQVLKDNSLFSSRKLPKMINIRGLEYKVVHPYKFEDDGTSLFEIDHSCLELKLKDNKDDSFSPGFLKSELILMTTICLLHTFCEHEVEFDVHTFASGFAQVCVDNDLEGIMKGK